MRRKLTFLIVLAILTLFVTDAEARKRRRKKRSSVPTELRGGRSSQEKQNRQAKAEGLKRIKDLDELRDLTKDGKLVRLEDSDTYVLRKVGELVDKQNSDAYRVALERVKIFLDRELPALKRETGRKRPFEVVSLARTDAYQKRVCEEYPRSAICGDAWWEVSSHVYGATVDIDLLNMTGKQIAKFQRRLKKLEKDGLIEAIQEKGCFHIMVFEDYPQKTEPVKTSKTKKPRKKKRKSR
ncbi:MAG: DUF5715 family protein [Patescibacteria group bacterium]|jgi:uncharacterized protein YcbK (DUF882 family)